MISNRLKRAWIARGTVAAAVLALPLLGAGVAQAAIAGANPSTTNGRPDLRSATILDATDIQVCFNKALAPTSPAFTNGSDLEVGGYRSQNTFGAATIVASVSNPNCVVATFPSSVGDLNQRTYVTDFSVGGPGAGTGGFVSAASGLSNLPDSVTLTGSTTHNGTAGLTVGPNLTGITTPATSTTAGVLGTVTYTFDQKLQQQGALSSGAANRFFIVDVNGDPCFGTTAVASGSSVVVAFNSTIAAGAPGTPCSFASINDARRGGVLNGAVSAMSDPPVFNPLSGQGLTTSPPIANGGITLLPDLTGATLQGDQNTVTYTFSKPISATSASTADFTVWLSNGEARHPNSIAVAGNNSVNAVYNNLANTVSEYAVLASVDGNAVTDLGGPPPDTAPNGWTDVPGSAAIGDNAGAFARGFTTGPDVFSVTFNRSASNPFVSVNLDQRIQSFCFGGCLTGQVLLLDANGGSLGGPSGAPALPNPEPAGPETVNIPFSSGQLVNATQIQIGDCALTTFLGFTDGCSVNQIVAPISSAVRLQAVRLAAAKARTHKVHKAHKTHKKH